MTRAVRRARAALGLAAWAAAVAGAGGCTVVQRFEPPSEVPPIAAPSPPSLPSTDAGLCLYDCLGGACHDGLCAPVELARDQGNANGLSFTGHLDDGREVSLDGPDELAADATHVYFSKLDGEIRRVPRAGGAVETVYEAPTRPPYAFVLDGDELFVALGWGIERGPKGGGAPATRVYGRVGDGTYAPSVAVAGGEVFWPEDVEVRACPRAGCTGAPRCAWAASAAAQPGGAISDVVAQEEPRGIGLFATTYDGRLSYVGLARGGSTCASPGAVSALYAERAGTLYGMARHGALTYAWGEHVLLHATAFGVPRYLASGVDIRPMRAVADAAHVYWIDATTIPTRLERVPVEGVSAPEVVLQLPRGVRNVAVDGDALLVSTGDGRVLRMAKPPAGALAKVR